MKIGDSLEVLDKSGAVLGALKIEEERSSAWCGVFLPTPTFNEFRPLLEEFTSIVNQQSFAHLDVIEEKIAALGLRGFLQGRVIPIFDLQIFDDRASVRTEPFRPV